ncbi:DUF2608 domain-containing protein [Aliikangiella sp. IMCC44653]
MKHNFYTLLFLFLACGGCVAKPTIYNNVKDLKKMQQAIVQDNAKPETTLVIFDIDDTLLEAKDFVGSGKWYNWQRGREVTSPDGQTFTSQPSERFYCIFRTLGSLFEFGSTELTQSDIPQVLDSVSQFDNLILTARTTKFRAPTERELSKHHIDFSSKHLLENNQTLIFNFNDGRRTAEVTYRNGIVMASGLNKGLVLKEILEQADKNYQHIYFIDDSRRNIDDMAAAWKTDSTQLSIFHYTKVDQTISENEVKQSNQAKLHLDSFLETAFPKQYKAFKQNQCQ